MCESSTACSPKSTPWTPCSRRALYPLCSTAVPNAGGHPVRGSLGLLQKTRLYSLNLLDHRLPPQLRPPPRRLHLKRLPLPNPWVSPGRWRGKGEGTVKKAGQSARFSICCRDCQCQCQRQPASDQPLPPVTTRSQRRHQSSSSSLSLHHHHGNHDKGQPRAAFYARFPFGRGTGHGGRGQTAKGTGASHQKSSQFHTPARQSRQHRTS